MPELDEIILEAVDRRDLLFAVPMVGKGVLWQGSNEAAIPEGRSARSLTWAGVTNTQYWLDLTRDIAAVRMTQSLPFCEDRFIRVYCEFGRAVYAEYAN